MGYLRLILAIFVVAQLIGGAKYLGASAVQVFFILSGYLMTAIMVRTYGYSGSGFARFWINRVLRLYPVYFIVIGLTAALVHVAGSDVTSGIVIAMAMPASGVEWLQNLTMVYADIRPITVLPRLSPATWALTLELACYLLISLGVTRSLRTTQIWLAVGACYMVLALFGSGAPQHWGYSAIPAAFLPFAVGALIYHLRAGRTRVWQWVLAWLPDDPARALTRVMAPALVAIFLCTVLRAGVFVATRSELAGMMFYLLNILPGAVAVIAAVEWRAASPRTRRLDKVCGDLAYPVYLAHWLVAVAIMVALPGLAEGILAIRPVAFLVFIGPILLVSLALVALVDGPVNRMRDAVRPGPGRYRSDRA